MATTLVLIGFSLALRLIIVSMESHDRLNEDVYYDIFNHFWSYDPFLLLFVGLCFDLTRLYLIAAALRVPDNLKCWALLI
jgi:hypothetical protein